VCAVERRRFPVGVSPHPATAPAGSNRSSHGGNEVAVPRRIDVVGQSRRFAPIVSAAALPRRPDPPAEDGRFGVGPADSCSAANSGHLDDPTPAIGSPTRRLDTSWQQQPKNTPIVDLCGRGSRPVMAPSVRRAAQQ
jgi:hypothetical protein